MKNRRSAHVLITALLGVMTIPVAVQHVLLGSVVSDEGDYAIFRSLDDDGMNFQGEDIRQDVIDYQSTFRAQRRAYSRAVERCRDRRREDESIECPEFNDADAYEADVIQPVHAAAEPGQGVREAPSSRELVRQLSTEERELLRTYTRAGFCSTTLGESLYELCRAIVGEEDTKTAPSGFINDNVLLHSRYAAPRPTLKLRLQMLDEAISGSRGRRTDVGGPMRYQGGLNK
ncbi:MAG TPA: hypothetical protein VJB10_05435 [Candidatus Peribacteraceae bacterium]|nr:hypothetical protein [Candidatus Peribacteraceae bacterium]